MLSLAKFLPLLDRNAVVKLYENRSCIYNGMARSIPESLWQCIVTDFDYEDDDEIVFKVMRKQSKPTDDHWHEGDLSVRGEIYHYLMKQYDGGSEFGIDGGRISKLAMTRGGKTVCHYERGWDVKPTDAEAQLALDTLLRTENH